MASEHEIVDLSCHICHNAWTKLGVHHICRLPGGYLCCESFGKRLLCRVDDSDKEGGSKQNDSGGEKKFLEVRYWGGSSGQDWDDGFYDGVRDVILVANHFVESIQVVYDKDGIPVSGEKHGNSAGNLNVQAFHVKLDYPKEYIVRVSGHVRLYKPRISVIGSIALKTNKRMFGPFGATEGLPFTFPLIGTRIVGFKGRSRGLLDAIGFHLSTDQVASY